MSKPHESKKVSPSSTLDEVNEALIFKGHPPSKILGLLLWVLTIGFWIVGIVVPLTFLLEGGGPALSFISSIPFSTITDNLSFILGIVTLISLISFIGGFLLLKLIHKAAREVTFIVFAGIPTLFLVGGIVLFIYFRVIFLLIFPIIGVVGLVLFVIFKDKLDVVGRTLELSARAIIAEPGQLVATLLSALIGFFTMICWGLTLVGIWNWLTPLIADNRIIYVIEVLVAFLGIWTVMFQKYFWDGVIVGIVHNWYRAPETDVASFGRGINKATKTMGGIAFFAFVMSILRALVSAARRRGGLSASIIAGLLGITEAIIKFLGFFALPAIIIRETGFVEGFKDSVDKLRDLLIEALASSFGFGLVLAVFALLISIFYGGLGYLFGAYLFPSMFGIVTPDIIIGLVSAFGFWIIGLIPTSLIFSTLTTTFNTILYEFGIDLEFGEKGQELPKRLPQELEQLFIDRLQEEEKAIPSQIS